MSSRYYTQLEYSKRRANARGTLLEDSFWPVVLVQPWLPSLIISTCQFSRRRLKRLSSHWNIKIPDFTPSLSYFLLQNPSERLKLEFHPFQFEFSNRPVTTVRYHVDFPTKTSFEPSSSKLFSAFPVSYLLSSFKKKTRDVMMSTYKFPKERSFHLSFEPTTHNPRISHYIKQDFSSPHKLSRLQNHPMTIFRVLDARKHKHILGFNASHILPLRCCLLTFRLLFQIWLIVSQGFLLEFGVV